MRLSSVTALALGAALLVGGSAQVQAGGGFSIGFGGGGGFSPYGGGLYGIPGLPGYGLGGSNNHKYKNNNNNNNNSARRTVTKSSEKPADNKPILITYPDGAGLMVYKLNDSSFTINAGDRQQFKNDRQWVVTFQRGGTHGTAKYAMTSGTYSFKKTTDKGWDLFREAD